MTCRVTMCRSLTPYIARSETLIRNKCIRSTCRRNQSCRASSQIVLADWARDCHKVHQKTPLPTLQPTLKKFRAQQRTFSTSSEQSHAQTEEKVNTVEQEEVDKFSRIAHAWWQSGGEFGALHTLNSLRVPLIRDAMVKEHGREDGHPETTKSRPLEGFTILDVGCGGGILSEPLARLGASVVGIDASGDNIQMAAQHAKLDPQVSGNVTYRHAAVEDMPADGEKFDAVVASEIIEHASDPHGFVGACCDLVKPGGSIFFTTINKTFASRALAVFAAENILRIVPQGAHDWNKFITPEDLQFMLSQHGMQTRLVHGMLLNPCSMNWSWVQDTSMNYALHAVNSRQPEH